MPDLVLLDNRNEDTVYLFSPEGGDLILRQQADSDKPYVAGYGSRKKIGVFRLRVITVAVYCDGPRLIVWIDGKSVDLCSDAVQGRIRRAGPFVREFRLTRSGKVLYACSYWHSGARSWPDDGDIFSLIERITASPDALSRTKRIWTAKLAGQPFVDEHT
jgi:hypothetical protein